VTLSPAQVTTTDVFKGSGSCDTTGDSTDTRGTQCGEMETDQYLDLQLVMMDIYGQPKNDEDDDRDIYMELEYFADGSGGTEDLIPYIESTASLWEYVLDEESDADDPVYRWLCRQPNCLKLAQSTEELTGDGTEAWTIDPNSPLYMAVTGFYRLHVYVLKYDITLTEIDPPLEWVRELGPNNSCEDEDVTDCDEVTSTTIGDGNSPYEFYVKPATSSAADSSVGDTDTGDARRRRLTAVDSESPRRSLFGWHLDDEEEAAAAQAQAAEDDPLSDINFQPEFRTVTRSTGHVEQDVVTGRRLLQTSTSTAPVLYAQAGVRKTMVIALRDNLGNAQKPDDSRRLDDLELTIGELTCLPGLNGTEECALGAGWPCGWVPQERGVPALIPVFGCTPAFVGYGATEGSVAYYDSLGPFSEQLGGPTPNYEPPEYSGATGMDVTLYNDFSAGTFVASFTVDQQLPSLTNSLYENAPDHYWLDLTLNGASMGGGPFHFVVLPGPVYGPMCEMLETSYADLRISEPAAMAVMARDKFGNPQSSSELPGAFQVKQRILTQFHTQPHSPNTPYITAKI